MAVTPERGSVTAATEPVPVAQGGSRGPAAASPGAPALVALVAVSALMLGTGVEILPAGGIVSIFTLGRLLIVAGLLGLVVGGARLADFRTALDIPIAILLLAAVVTTVDGGHEVAPLRFLITVVLLYYLTVVLWRRHPESRETLPLVALIAVVASAVVGVAQVAQDTPTSFYREGFSPIVSTTPRPDLLQRAIGSFDNPNLLATHVLLLAPLGAVAALGAATRSLRVVLVALVGLAYVGLLLTFSRAGIGAALLSAGVVAYARRPALRDRIRAVAAVGAAVLALGVVATGGDLVGGFGRPEAWSTAVRVAVQERPLTGIGLARAGDVMNAVGDNEIRFRHAHNLWLTWWVEAGPLALLAVIWITGWLVLRGYHDATRGSAIGAAGLAGVVGFFAFSMLDHPANVERIATAFWLVAGLLAAGATAGPGVRDLAGRVRRAAVARRTGALTLLMIAGVTGAVSACGSEDEDETAATPPPSTAPTAQPPSTPAPSPAPPGQPEEPRELTPPPGGAEHRRDGERPRSPADGGSEPVRAEAVVTGRRGRLAPRLVRVPAYVAVRLVLRSADGAGYGLELGRGRRVSVGQGQSEDTLELDGLAPGQRYTARPENGGPPVVIEASAEPGP